MGFDYGLKVFIETYVVLVRGPFDLVAGSYADAGGEGGFEFDGESGEGGGGEEGG